jgi:multicomponent Na+:H+ antiporter subunit C
MEVLLAVCVGALYGGGVYMLLRRSIVRLLFAFVLLGAGANLLIFASAGIVRGRAPIAPPGQPAPIAPVSDPLAQALILTAIVISFGVLAFAMVLVKRQYDTMGTDDLDTLDSPSEAEILLEDSQEDRTT